LALTEMAFESSVLLGTHADKENAPIAASVAAIRAGFGKALRSFIWVLEAQALVRAVGTAGVGLRAGEPNAVRTKKNITGMR